MQFELCLENHTLQSSPALEAKPEVPPAPPLPGVTGSSGVGRKGRVYKIKDDSRKRHDLYGIWKGMRNRCLNPKGNDYHHYGGRGITICERWDDFLLFAQDMGPRPSKLHKIDRIHNNGNYEPENCKWSTQREQMQNTRINHYLTVNGVTKTLSQWGREIGITPHRIWDRLDRGWTSEEALSVSKKRRGASRLSPEQVIQIRHDPRSAGALSKVFGVCIQTVCNARNGVLYKDVVG